MFFGFLLCPLNCIIVANKNFLAEFRLGEQYSDTQFFACETLRKKTNGNCRESPEIKENFYHHKFVQDSDAKNRLSLSCLVLSEQIPLEWVESEQKTIFSLEQKIYKPKTHIYSMCFLRGNRISSVRENRL